MLAVGLQCQKALEGLTNGLTEPLYLNSSET